MDKNLAALMRQDARTVRVTFGGQAAIDDYSELAEFEVRIDNAEPKLYVAEQRKSGKGYAISPAHGGKTYTYVTDLLLAIGDCVVVPVKSTIALAFVVAIDEDVNIEPDDPTEYSWVISVVDMARHAQNMARNAEITSLVAKAKKHNMRDAFRHMLLGQMGGNDQLLALIGAPPAPKAD